MSTKTSTAQPPGRRTPLSLNSSTKQINKPTNDKNDNSKKESNTNNQKTENPKKDSQPERKPSSDKLKQSSTEARKPSSSDSKRPEEVKTTKNEENKKNQNGVNTNGVKDKEKQNTNEGTIKAKPTPSSSGSGTPKKESSKTIDKKKETATEAVAKETKNEDNKNKVDEKNKEKGKSTDDYTSKLDEKKKEKERKEDVKEVDEKKKGDEKKKIDGKPAEVISSENAKEEVKIEKNSEDIIELESSIEMAADESPTKGKKNDELIASKTPLKERKSEEKIPSKTPLNERKIEDSPKAEEKQAQSPTEEVLEDVEMMDPLTFEAEPSPQVSAASTPAKDYNRRETYNRAEGPFKSSPKSEVKPSRAPSSYTPDKKNCPRTFSSISGRRSIRPIGDYTFSGNLQIRESYRKIKTELDFTSSSLNVTVGSEVPNNDSFSFFSRSRKRDRSSPTNQSAMEVQADLSPKSPKRARIDLGMANFFNAMASPITMLRARLSRATVQSTPKKQVDVPIEEDIVQNVSGISVEEDITATEDLTVNPDSTVGNAVLNEDISNCEEPSSSSPKPAVEEDKNEDIKIRETFTTTDSQAKKKCSVM